MSDATPTPEAPRAADLPKRYDHKAVEPGWIARWEESGIYRYDPTSDAAAAGRTFSIDTPPPYVSAAHLHVGHAMSYSQAEFVIRFKRMRGYEVFYPMGFDDNGLPTERYVEKKHKVHKGRVSRDEFVALCLEETRKGAAVYEELWRSLGLSVDWRMTYSTIQPRAVEHAQRSFLELVRHGHIERRADPILWDPSMQTALAQADVEAGEETSRPLHQLRFPRAGVTEDRSADGLIDTTRPELVTACVALACHPDDERFAGLSDVRFEVPLTELRPTGASPDDEGAALSAPTGERRSVPLIRDEAVDPEFGTGLMMVCTFGDQEDIIKWRTHDLDTMPIIGADGRMETPEIPELHGQRVHVLAKKSRYPEARLVAKELLDREGYLLGVEDSQARPTVSERSGTPVEIQIVPQWFIKQLELKDALLARGRELNWHPTWMRDRFEHWVDGLKWDWNISRQRFYGVPFPVWYREDNDEPVFPALSDLPLDPLVDEPPESVRAQVPDGVGLRAEEDVMDTWMTSSLTPLINANWTRWDDETAPSDDIALQGRPGIYPMGVRVQAFEIIRTWLFYTVLKAHLHTDSLPWRDVMISGWGLDRNGKKMSKRFGNFVDPAKIIEQYSADALRYWASGATLGHDLRFLEEDVKGGKRLLTKLWNSTRFALMSIEGLPVTGRDEDGTVEAPTAADLWIRAEVVRAVEQATTAFDTYEYSKAVRTAEDLFWKLWCDHYLEIVKDRFRNPDDWGRGAVLAGARTIFEGTWALLRLFAPVLPFITEELYQRAIKPVLEANGEDAPQSVHVAAWPKDEQTGAVDVFDGTSDEAHRSSGAFLMELVGAIRHMKTDGQLGLGRPIEKLWVQASDADHARIDALAADWLAASRAPAIERGEPTGVELQHERLMPAYTLPGREITLRFVAEDKRAKP
jgi:valyl-tRNA synthetase